MLSSSVRKSLTASAILATSVAAAAGLVPSAEAAPGGPATSPLTTSNGTATVVIGGQTSSFLSTVTDAAWAPDGSRVAYIDDKNQVVTARPDGSWPFVAAPAAAGVTRSHPTWTEGGTAIAFTEVSGGSSTIKAVQAYTPSDQTPTVGGILSFLGGQTFTEGTESAVDSNGRALAFQHVDATNTSQVYIQDGFGRGSSGPKLVGAGTEPTLSPDGTKVAYLVKDGAGAEQIWVAGWDGQNGKVTTAAKAITTDAHDHLRPTWSPDGTRIAFENAGPAGGAAIDVQSVDAAGANPKQESATPGVPAYQPLVKNKLERLSGDSRITTAISASQAAWPASTSAQGAASSVVLSRSDQFADALGGATLANSAFGPLLLTPTDHLESVVQTEIARVLGPANASKTVYILGGEKALSPAVFNTVSAMGYTVKRIQGPDRYATSVEIAKQVTGTNGPDSVLVATANNYPDALSAGAAASAPHGFGPPLGVVVLTNDKTMPASTAAYLSQVAGAQVKPQVYGVGGQADSALTTAGIAHTKVAGQDRYQTSYLVARTFFTGFGGEGSAPRNAGFATALSWPDALSGGAFMGRMGGPLILINPTQSTDPQAPPAGPLGDEQTWLSGWSGSIDTAYVFGGTAAVSDVAAKNSAGFISGPAGYDLVPNPKA
jgi:hypothetical protein